MKRLLPLILALAIILAVTGCIYNGENNVGDPNTPAVDDGPGGEDVQAPPEDGPGEDIIPDDGNTGGSSGETGGEANGDPDHKDGGGQENDDVGITLAVAPGAAADVLAPAAGGDLRVVTESSPADELKAGSCDAAVVAVSEAARLYREKGGINVAALLTSGGWLVAEKGDTINGILDLGGKVIYAPAEAKEAAAVLGYIAGEYGFVLGETLVIETVSDPEARDTSLLPEGGMGGGQRAALSLLTEWEYATGRELLPGLCLAVSSGMGGDELDSLLDAVGAALEGASDTEATEYVFITGAERLRETLEDHLELLYGVDPDVLGGSIPDDGFYR